MTKTTKLVAAAAIVAVVGCNNSDKNNASSANNGNAPSPAANASAQAAPMQPGTTASNADNNGSAVGNATITGGAVSTDPLANVDDRDKVKRSPNEEKLVPTEERIVVDQITLRDSPRGASLGMAKAGDKVLEIAKDQRYLLVTLPDPDHSDKQMAAWIFEDAVMNPSTIPERGARGAKQGTSDEKKPTCKNGEIGVRTDHDFCARTCASDADCAKGNAKGVCDGSGLRIVGNGHDAEVKYCVGQSRAERSGSSKR